VAPASGTPRCILFVDCDRFYFAVEAAERPGLAAEARAVIIGHDPRDLPRAIVTTANDPARSLGIHSGMSARMALRLAPNALFLPPRHDVYARYSALVMAVLRQESPLVQQNSIDEAACAWPHGFVAARLREEGLLAGEVALKLRYADWQTITRQMRLEASSHEVTVLAAAAAALMRKHWNPQREVRLIGLCAGHLVDAKSVVQLPLLQA
jgi:nucleotidyltransferase/DNA polymerase involved in DNA repair